MKIFGRKMNNIISIPFDFHFDEKKINEDQEQQHLVDIRMPKDLSIFRGGLVEILWKQHHDSNCFKNTYLPIQSRSYLFSSEIKGFYNLESTTKSEPGQILFIFNLNDFYLPIYALKQSLSLVNKENLISKKIYILLTHDIEFSPINYIFQFMQTLSGFFGTIPEILTVSELLKRNNLYDFSFHTPGIDWLTLDSSIRHLLLSKGASPFEKTDLEKKAVLSFKLSPFHEIKFYDIKADELLNHNQVVAPRFVKSQMKLFSSGKIHKPSKIPYYFFQMIFN